MFISKAYKFITGVESTLASDITTDIYPIDEINMLIADFLMI